MNTIIIATDFSVTAMHAATYICKLSDQLKPKRILLYYALENINPDRILITDILAPSSETISEERDEAMLELNMIIEMLSSSLNPSIKIEPVCTDHSLLKGINELVIHESADLVVMGISGKGNQNKNIIGSNTLKLMRECRAPLLVVPSNGEYSPLTKVMLAWDHKNTKETLPAFEITSIVQQLNAKLFVVNIDTNGFQSAAEIIEEGRDLNNLLKSSHPELHYPKERSVTDGLVDFSIKHDINIMIIVPKKVNFWIDFFSQKSTQKIALRTEIPLLIMRKY